MLISETHRQRYEQHYAAKYQMCAVRKHSWHDYIQKLVVELCAVDLLDYGSGPDMALEAHIEGCDVCSYDPAIAALKHPYQKIFDLVVCSHTLEHVEEEYVPDIIADLMAMADEALLIVVSLKPSTKVLPDGTPWHTCVHPADWWRNQFQDMPTFEEPPCRLGEYAALFRC